MLILGRSVGENNVSYLVPLLLDLLLRFFIARELGRLLWFSGTIGTSKLFYLALSIKRLTSGLIELSSVIGSSTLICCQLFYVMNGELIRVDNQISKLCVLFYFACLCSSVVRRLSFIVSFSSKTQFFNCFYIQFAMLQIS